MALSRRGKITLALIGVLALGGGAVGVLALTGNTDVLDGVLPGDQGSEAPPVCPLTGEIAERPRQLARRALAIKVENLPAARPQAGLAEADIVYEEPVEGGISRFIAVFHCDQADRVGPVRSARLVDADVLAQFGTPIFGYAGAVPQVVDRVALVGLTDVRHDLRPDDYERDPSRSAPHDLFTSTRVLYRAGGKNGGPPPAVFTFERRRPAFATTRATEIHVPYSEADVIWRYDRPSRTWLRYHGDTPHVTEGGTHLAAANVIVQEVEISDSDIIDAAGNPSPEIDVIGRGRAFVFRNGRVIRGRWIRRDVDDLTRFETRDGQEIPLRPGVTWVELYPSDREVEFSAGDAG